MKRKMIFTTCAFVLVITGVLVSKANARRIDASYTTSISPSVCSYPTTLPGNCTIAQTGTICSSVSGSVTFKYYQGMNCVVPYYKIN